MDFEINSAHILDVADHEIRGLLNEVYVAGGFVTPEEALTLFEPAAVRNRGNIIAARNKQDSTLVGMLIVVPPDSAAKRLTKDNEAEIHLLGVAPEYQKQGVGRKLVEAAIEYARHQGYSKMILWTQLSMIAAQKLYEATGFKHVNDMTRNGRNFKVYEMSLYKNS